MQDERTTMERSRWAGGDPVAMELGERGASTLGDARWRRAYAAEPEACLAEVGGAAALARWRQGHARLTDPDRTLLECVSASPVGLSLSALIATAPAVPCAAAVARLVASHWMAHVEAGRVEVPPVRRHLIAAWRAEPATASAAVRAWLRRYTLRRLSGRGIAAPWTEDDTACLAACLQQMPLAETLDTEALIGAATVLRRSQHAPIGVDALRGRLEVCEPADVRVLRRTLGAALIDMGVYGEGLVALERGRRDSEIVRAHGLLRIGETRQGRAVLRELGPRRGDLNWVRQWALAAIGTRDSGARAMLEEALVAARDRRHRGLVWARLAELADPTDTPSTPLFARAVNDLDAGGDAFGAAYCQARHARALLRIGRRDEGAQAATAAWSKATALPGAMPRGFAALACVESGVASSDTLRSALQAAAMSERPDLARDARRLLAPVGVASTVSLGNGQACVDGAPVALTPNGPPWRVLDHLCRLPEGAIVTVAELFDAGWPGERVHPDSRRRRVQTAIWTLRRAGLRDVIQTVAGNRYRLDAKVVLAEAGP